MSSIGIMLEYLLLGHISYVWYLKSVSVCNSDSQKEVEGEWHFIQFQDSLLILTTFHNITFINSLAIHEFITDLTRYVIILNSDSPSLRFNYSVLG
jgi:hypothetical protein